MLLLSSAGLHRLYTAIRTRPHQKGGPRAGGGKMIRNQSQTAEFLAGSTPLRVATITDGQFLKRVGSEIQSAAAGGSVSLLFGDGSTGSGTIVNTTLITDAPH